MATKNQIRDLKRYFLALKGDDRVRAVVAHVLADVPGRHDVFVGGGRIVIRSDTKYIGDVVRQIVWWIKELGGWTLVRSTGDGIAIDYLLP